MTEITYKELDTHLSAVLKEPARRRPQAYLFFGEELLYKKAFETFVAALVPATDRAMNCEPVDGAPENIRDAVNRANTYAMLPGNKVIVIQESRIFYGKQDREKLLGKAKEAFQREEIGKAARYVLSLLGQLGLALADVETQKNRSVIFQEDADSRWFDEVVAHCRENELPVSTGDRPDQFLAAAVEKGFPQGNYLALTADLVDKRRSLFLCLKDRGVVVDCSVPKGDRRADRQLQEEVLNSRMLAILGGSGKRIEPQAASLLRDMTGFDLRAFSNNLEKLILYIGERPVITAQDVRSVLERSRQDPIYALTGAVAERKPAQAIGLLDSLIQDGLHPLQLFVAIVNQIRKLLVAKCFTQSPGGRTWKPGMPFGAFKAGVLNEMTVFDRELIALTDDWEKLLSGEEAPAKGRRKKKEPQKQKIPNDLLSAATPRNPYPIYLTLKNADNFSLAELTRFYSELSDTDMKLKRSARNPKLVLEEIILKICQKPDAPASGIRR